MSSNSEVRIEGLETLDYLDNLNQRERFTDQGNSLTFESEVRDKQNLSLRIHGKKHNFVQPFSFSSLIIKIIFLENI